MTPVTAVALALLVLGVVATVESRLPGGVLSLLGVYLYWWSFGYDQPPLPTVALLTLVGLLAIGGHLYGRFLADRVRRASRVIAVIAGLVGAAIFPFAGTSGFLIGLVVTGFLLEYLRRRNLRGSFKAVVVVVASSLASKITQLLLTGAMLVVMLEILYL